MDEENKQVTADEVYSYGESTEEPEEKEAVQPEQKWAVRQLSNGFKRLDTDIDRITDPVCWNSHVFCMGIRK